MPGLTDPDKGYHIRHFPDDCRRIARAGANISGVPIGQWVGAAVREKFQRDVLTTAKEASAHE